MESERLKSFLIWAKTLLQRLLAPLGLRPSRTIAGHRFSFDPATDIGVEILVTGQFEKNAIEQCANYIGPDGIVVDVGANIGIHTVHFADMVPSGKVICFEPARATFTYLLENVKHLTNVIPVNLALSDFTSLQTFFVAADDAYSGLKDTKRKAILRREPIACVRGDDILLTMLQGLRVDLIKIDVEGVELQVLSGMKEFIVTHKPVIFCEIFGGLQSNPDPEATVQFCLSLGYDAFVLDGAQLKPAGTHSDRFYNYLFIPRRPK